MPSGADDPVPSPLSSMDEAGRVYMTSDRVLRAVPRAAALRMRALLESGLTDALAEAELMPATRISDRSLPDSALVIEHPRLPYVTYPYEWSFGMLQAAAVCVLDVNSIANRHGYELADCHGFNVVFDGARPHFVDLGSLVFRPAHARGWLALEEFVRFYEYPLKIWSDGGGFMARRLVAASELMSHGDYGVYRWPWLRGRLAGSYDMWRRGWFRYRLISRFNAARVSARLPAGLRGLGKLALESRFLPARDLNLSRIRAGILRLSRAGPQGFWSAYQGNEESFVDTPRFRRVAEIIGQARLGSLIELAGNRGWLAGRLLATGAVQRAICTDADEPAIDHAYRRSATGDGLLQTAVLDFVHPMVNPFGEPPAQRLRCDGVVALAVTHHLLLTQRVPVERMLKTLASYAKRCVFVEFMPLGLWDGTKAPPIPEWYNVDWFRAAFAREFILDHEESLEPNRYLFCGRVRAAEETGK